MLSLENKRLGISIDSEHETESRHSKISHGIQMTV